MKKIILILILATSFLTIETKSELLTIIKDSLLKRSMKEYISIDGANWNETYGEIYGYDSKGLQITNLKKVSDIIQPKVVLILNFSMNYMIQKIQLYMTHKIESMKNFHLTILIIEFHIKDLNTIIT